MSLFYDTKNNAPKMKHEIVAKNLNDNRFVYLTDEHKNGYKCIRDNTLKSDLQFWFDPNIEKNEQINIFMITGPNGSGKSYMVTNLIEAYILFKRSLKKDYNIVIFSQKPKGKHAWDEQLNFEYLQVKLPDPKDNFINEKGLNIYELQKEGLINELYKGINSSIYQPESFFIFDDVDKHTDEDVLKAVIKFRNNILTLSRSDHTHIAVTTHDIDKNHALKQLYNQTNVFICFPNKGKVQYQDFLKKKLRIPNDIVKKIIEDKHFNGKTSRYSIIIPNNNIIISKTAVWIYD